MLKTLPDSFMNKIKFTETCWLWKASKNQYGYGCYRNKGKTVLSHRFSWNNLNGEIPDGLLVLHRCDVRHCLNPDHLFLGTHKDNSTDMVIKGKSTKGETHRMAKLTLEQVFEIRNTHKPNKGEFSKKSLAKKIWSQSITC